ncbi:MAG: M14 family metallopeptidase [Candidatus Bathyarchaeia archaeon]
MVGNNNQLIDLVKWSRLRLNHGPSSSITISIGNVGKKRPRALIIAGTHGDEQPWGALAIRMLLKKIELSDLYGSIRIIPNANPYAMEENSRVSHLDNLDLNRVFPGDENGSYSEKIAAIIVKEGLKDVDVVIDLHGGGSWCVNSFAFRFPGSESLTEAMCAPFTVDGVERNKTLTGYAKTRGMQILGVEMGGRCDEEEQWAEKISTGLLRVLSISGILKKVNMEKPHNSILVGPTKVLRPLNGGVFIPKIKSKHVGEILEKGTKLGSVCDPVSLNEIESFTAPFDKTAILLLRPTMTTIESGAMTYVVAPLY